MGKTPNPGGANSGMAEPGADPFEGQRVDEPIFLEVLEPAIDALEAAGVPYGIMGGLASASLGRPLWTHDIDFFVRPDTAGAALEALERAGFTTQQTNAYWLYKGIRDAVLVDVLFQSRGGIFLDEEMLSGPPASSSTGGTSCRGPRRVLSLLLYALSVTAAARGEPV